MSCRTISLKSSLEKAAAFGSALRRAFADASAAFVGVAKGEAEVAAQYPLGRLGVPEDIAGAVVYFASADAAGVTRKGGDAA